MVTFECSESVDVFELMSGMISIEKTYRACKSDLDLDFGGAASHEECSDWEYVEPPKVCERLKLWDQHGCTNTLLDSCSRQLVRLRSCGFEIPWQCMACNYMNFNWCHSCEVCKSVHDEFRLALDACVEDANCEDHGLLVLARTKGACEIEACFALCEAMANERLAAGKATVHYRRAFKLWPELDSNMRSDGIPVALCGEVDALLGSRRSRHFVSESCPILGDRFARPKCYQALCLPPEEAPDHLLCTFDIDGVAKYIIEQPVVRVVVLCGAGVSTSAGIPDFRSPGSGLYENLQMYNLPRPEDMFTLSYFRNHPAAFYDFAKELWPGNYRPTPSHYFVRLLHEKGMLLRCYSQNIDSLELLAGLPSDKLVAAHGNFDGAHIIDTDPKVSVDIDELKEALNAGCQGWKDLCEKKGGLVKPNIVFFGEALPEKFSELHPHDLSECDLLLVLGTSLTVAPFNSLVGKVNASAPRLLINRDPVGLCDYLPGGFQFHITEGRGANWRDVFYQGDVDVGVLKLVAALGWTSEFEELMREESR